MFGVVVVVGCLLLWCLVLFVVFAGLVVLVLCVVGVVVDCCR